MTYLLFTRPIFEITRAKCFYNKMITKTFNFLILQTPIYFRMSIDRIKLVKFPISSVMRVQNSARRSLHFLNTYGNLSSFFMGKTTPKNSI